MKRTFILSVLIASILTSCGKDRMNWQNTRTFDSYVSRYYDAKGLILEYDSCTLYSNYPFIISPENLGDCYYYNKYNQGKQEMEKFDSLCEANKDLDFDHKLTFLNSPEWGHCYADNFSKVEVRSSKDFDADHPAGTLLNDIIKVEYHSLQPFVESGYDYPCDDILSCLPDANVYTKLASELLQDDLHMISLPAMGSGHRLSDYLRFSFTKKPEPQQNQTISVKLITTTGEALTAQMEFDKWANLNP